MTEDTVSGWSYIFMGFACGVAVGVLAAPSLGLGEPHWQGDEPDKEKEGSDEPGIGKKILDKIPTRVKVKTVTGGLSGAVKGGGGEAYHEIKKKITGER